MRVGKTGVSIVAFFWVFFCGEGMLLAQENIPIGTWRTHFQYNNVKKVIIANDKIYAATENTIFYLDREDNSLNKLTQIDGLSEVGISAIYYDQTTDRLLIGYNNGVIDILQDNEIETFEAIAQSPQLQNKKITALFTEGDVCYVGTSIGVVVFDLKEVTIIESYTEIGPDATRVIVNDMVLRESMIFLATDKGLMLATLDENLNLQDFNNWSLSIPPGSDPTLSQLAATNEKIFAGHFDQLFTFQENQWTALSTAIDDYTLADLDGQQELLITGRNNSGSIIWDAELRVVFESEDKLNAAAGSSTLLYLATQDKGLLQVEESSQSMALTLPGPPFDQLGQVKIIDDDAIAIPRPGALFSRSSVVSGQYGSFSGGTWQIVDVPQLNNITDVAQSSNSLYLSSTGGGLINLTDGIVYNSSNPDHPLLAETITDSLIIVPAIEPGLNGELWVLNKDADPGLHKLNGDGSWDSYSLGFGQGARFPETIAISAKTGLVWVASDPGVGGLYLYDPQEEISLTLSNAEGLPSNRINDLVIDREDEVWLATERGIAFFQSSESPFFDGFDEAIIPVIEGALLLDRENITALTVDGGNRKWVGTYDGLWLIEESGDMIIDHFTTENSPLPSDSISALDINPTTGEVFIATPGGLISYRTNASAAGNTFQAVRIYPNPVPPGYNGLIGIYGLAEDVNVKITDLSGRLVNESFANGGTTSWDGRDIQGQYVNAGIYLVFSGNRDGSETFVGKFAVIR